LEVYALYALCGARELLVAMELRHPQGAGDVAYLPALMGADDVYDRTPDPPPSVADDRARVRWRQHDRALRIISWRAAISGALRQSQAASVLSECLGAPPRET
jgi:hypothetical protein